MKYVLNIRKFISKFLEDDHDPIDNSMRLIKRIIRIVGIHNVYEDKKRRFTPLSTLLIILNLGCFFYLGILSQLVYLVRMFPDVGEIFKALDCLSATCIPFSIYAFLWHESYKDNLRKIFELSRAGLMAIPADKTGKPLRSAIRKAKYISWLVIANLGAVHVAYIVIPVIFTLCGMRTIPTTPGGPIGLTPLIETPNFEIAFVVTVFGTIFSAVNQLGYYILFLTLLSHELGHYYSIIGTLNDLQKYLHDDSVERESKNEHVEKTLKFCIKHHQFLITYHKAVKQMYRGIFGVHYLIMIMILITTLQTIKVWDIRNTLLTGATGIMPLIIYCFGGEFVTSAGEDLAKALHFCGWENMIPVHRKYVLFMLVVAQKPLQLTAGDVFLMNRKTFGDVVQVVYKIYAVFN